jgi:hypothetical protein
VRDSMPGISSPGGRAISWSMISPVMLPPKICDGGPYTDGRSCRPSGWYAHNFRALGCYSCFMKSMILAAPPDNFVRAASGRSVMSTQASALAFMSRSTSA